MNTKRKLSLAVLTIGIAVSSVGCSSATLPVNSPTSVASVSATPEATTTASPEVTPTAEANAPTATATPVETTAAPAPAAEPVAPAAVEPVVEEAPAPVVEEPVPAVVAAPAKPAKAAAPVQKAPAPAPAAVQAAPAPSRAAPPIQAPPAVSREVYVGLSGGQAVVDQGRGPVLFPLPGGFPPYVAEHDLAGGWARFGTLSPGMTVRMSGLVGGTYTVGQIINVPKGGSTAELRQFSVMPKVMLQTCIPGTSRMIVVGLY